MGGARYVPLPLFLLQLAHKDFTGVYYNSICLGIFRQFKEGKTKEEIQDLFYQLPQLTDESFNECLERGEEVQNMVSQYNEPTPHVKLSMLLEFKDRSKTIEQIDEFCLYVSIRSVIPKSYPCWKTNNEFLFRRMLGYKDKIPEDLPEHIRVFRDRYYTKKGELSSHKFNSLIRRLEANWRVRKLSQTETRQQIRGFYIGILTDKKTFLAMYKFATRKKRKQQQVQKDKMDAIRKFKNNEF